MQAIHPLTITAQQRPETGFLNRIAIVAGQSYLYQVYVPADYIPSASWPVILFLHGSGECGSDGLLQTTQGLAPAIRKDPSRFPAIVVFPQAPPNSRWEGTPAEVAMAALHQTLSEFHADLDRVYMTGLSLGGRGVWYLAYRHPDLFAAVVPICGWAADSPPTPGAEPVVPPEEGAPLPALAQRLRQMPIWIFHGEMDAVLRVAESQALAAALKEAGGNVRFTECLGLEHNSWDAAYASREFTTWLFAQRRNKR
jgi:predicted peptidase